MKQWIRQWMISRIPTRILIYLVSRNYRLRMAGRKRDEWYWADLEISRRDIMLCPNCFNQIDFAERCPFCYPLVIGPEWLLTKPESYGYDDEPEGDQDD